MNSTWTLRSRGSQPLWGPGEPKHAMMALQEMAVLNGFNVAD